MWSSPHKASKEGTGTEEARNKTNGRSRGEDNLIEMSKGMIDLSRATERLHCIWRKIASLQLRIGHARMSITNGSTTLKPTPETVFLRVCYKKSFCRYDPSLGILSSNFAACKPVKCIDELKPCSELTETTLRDHCSGDSATSFILLTNDGYSLSRYINGKWQCRVSDARSSAMVAFVNKEKSDYMRIFCATLRSLVEDVGTKCWSPIDTDGVNYASHEHCMVYGWIPLRCIERIISLVYFEHTWTQILCPFHAHTRLHREGCKKLGSHPVFSGLVEMAL